LVSICVKLTDSVETVDSAKLDTKSTTAIGIPRDGRIVSAVTCAVAAFVIESLTVMLDVFDVAIVVVSLVVAVVSAPLLVVSVGESTGVISNLDALENDSVTDAAKSATTLLDFLNI